jgi:rRNA processing protein Gar1
MFELNDTVKVKSDGRIGKIKSIEGDSKTVKYLVRFDNKIEPGEWFTPEQLELVKKREAPPASR